MRRVAAILTVVLGLVATCSGFGFNFGGGSNKEVSPQTTPVPIPVTPPRGVINNGGDVAEPHYTFRYVVQDARTGDYKSQEERRDGGNVRGTYSVAEPNGDLRVVSYSADGDSGFRAEVRVEPAGTISNSQSQEGRTFANFLGNPFNLFTGAFRSKPVNTFENRPVTVVNRPVTHDNRPAVTHDNRPAFVDHRPIAHDNKPVGQDSRPVDVRPGTYDGRPVAYDNRQLAYQQRLQFFDKQVPSTNTPLFQDKPNFYSNRQTFIEAPVYSQQTDDLMPTVGMYPVYDRAPETTGITPASTYQLFNKPIVADSNIYNRPQEFQGYRTRLPETPAIPITPSSPLEYQPQGDIITAPVKTPNFYPPNYQMFRRPSTPITRPTAPTPIRYSTPSQSPFQFMRYTPTNTAPPVLQRLQPNNWQYPPYMSGYGPYSGFAGAPYMLVKTYLVPMPPGGIPANLLPQHTHLSSQPIIEPTNPTVITGTVKTTPVTETVERTESPVTTPQTTSL